MPNLNELTIEESQLRLTIFRSRSSRSFIGVVAKSIVSTHVQRALSV